jgi:hypothetical protein
LEIDFNLQVYDFDTRIHLLIKGPGIAPGSSFDFLASNVDLAPTMLSLADIPRPPGAMRQTKQQQQPPSFSLSGVPFWYQHQPLTDLSRQARDERKGKWTEGSVLVSRAGMDGKSFLPMVLSAESLLPPSSQTAATTAAAAAAAAVPGSVLRYARAHPAASVRSSWRDTHFIEYYYIGIGGYCGMLEPIEQPDNNFIAIRCANATCLVLSCLEASQKPSIYPLLLFSRLTYVLRVHVVPLRQLCAQEGRPLHGRRHALR